MCKFVLLILFVLSVVCWTLVSYKAVLLRRKRRELERALFFSKTIEKIDGLLTVAARFHYAFPGAIFSCHLAYVKALLMPKQNTQQATLNRDDFELLKHVSEQEVEAVMVTESSYVSLLSVTAAVAPLLGLFGTVWGLIDAFIRISQKQNADIATVAPGVAEALITTAAGLMVAIPALAMVYYINSQLQQLEHLLYKLSDHLLFTTYRLFGASVSLEVQDGEPTIVEVLDIASQPKKEYVWHE